MIAVKNLTKIYKTHLRQGNPIADFLFRKYKETTALENVSLEIGNNELVGFIGPNGAGKTTTLKILAGILYPTKGEVNVLGFTPFEKKTEFLKQIGFVMGQRNQLLWDLPPLDTFSLNKEIYELEERQYNQTVNELSTLLDCQHLLSKPVKTLSLGERMKMELIAGLLHRPKIVFFDEPTIGLDIFSQEVVRNFIKKFQEEFRATIILTSHYLEDVKKLAKRIIIVNKGKIIYDGALRAIIQKYSYEKLIVVTLDKEVDQEIITSVGTPVSYHFPQIIYKIKKSELPEKINLISRLLPFSDLTIEEEKIEDIIKSFFKSKQ